MRVVLNLLLVALIASIASAETMEQCLTNQLLERYRLDSAFVRISLIHSDLTTTELSGLSVRMISLVQSEPRGRFPVRVEIFSGGVLSERGSASLEVRLLADLPVPIKPIQRNEALSPDLFSMKRCDVTTLVENTLRDPGDVIGRRARQVLPAGQMIPLHKIERIPDVENGRVVNIVGTSGLLEIRLRGTALQSGTIGETIQVRNTDSKRIFSARVTGPGTVEIAL